MEEHAGLASEAEANKENDCFQIEIYIYTIAMIIVNTFVMCSLCEPDVTWENEKAPLESEITDTYKNWLRSVGKDVLTLQFQ